MQAWVRSERENQTAERESSESIFLARLTRIDERPAVRDLVFTTITRIEGRDPPARLVTGQVLSCGGYDWRVGDVAIIYSQQVDPNDLPLKPWRWGQWVAFLATPPEALYDPGMVAALRETATRLRQTDAQ